jgi:endonuclease/exonuclease/phosphatase family metal-dependent hydrolase
MWPDPAALRRRLRPLASIDVLIPLPAPHNYGDPAGPRYAGGAAADGPPGPLHLVTFNIKFAEHPDLAVRLIRESAELREPGVLLLQEMTAPAVELVARELGMAWVYYPSTVHPIARQDFGCAILSRYPMRDDRKILLPHLARLRRIQRAAVAVTIVAHGRSIRIANVHLSTMVDNGPRQRREQLVPVLEDAAPFEHAIIAGDFNSDRVAGVAVPHGFTWPTRHLGPTNALWAMDHILLKGLELVTPVARGSVRDTVGASDHKPVWARIALGGSP